MTPSVRVELIGDADRLFGLEAAWWALFACCPTATPFRSPAWLLPWWGVFAPGPLRTVAVWSGGDLVALAPLYLEAESRRLLPLGIGLSDDLDMLVALDAGPHVGADILDAVSHATDWESMSLEELSPGASALSWALPTGWSGDTAGQSCCPTLTWEQGADIGAVVPPGKLRKLRMARHRTERRGAAVEVATSDTAPDHLEALFRLHAARWESRGEAGVLADASVQAFHRLATPRLAAAGLLHAALLRIDGQVAGVFHGLRRGQSLFAYLGGFDPAFAFESPGTVLMGDALDRMMAGGAGMLNLLRGTEPYKYEWGAVDQVNGRRLLRRPGL